MYDQISATTEEPHKSLNMTGSRQAWTLLLVLCVVALLKVLVWSQCHTVGGMTVVVKRFLALSVALYWCGERVSGTFGGIIVVWPVGF